MALYDLSSGIPPTTRPTGVGKEERNWCWRPGNMRRYGGTGNCCERYAAHDPNALCMDYHDCYRESWCYRGVGRTVTGSGSFQEWVQTAVAPRIGSMQDEYELLKGEKAYIEPLNTLPPSPPPPPGPPPPPAPCLLDIVIGIDGSGSMALNYGYGNNEGANDFVREFVNGLDSLMDGSITGIPGSSNAQVGTYVWRAASYGYGDIVRNMTNASSLIENDTNIQNPVGYGTPVLGVPVHGGQDYGVAVSMGMTMLNNFGGSALGDRSSQPNYRRIMIIITDGMWNPPGSMCQAPSPFGQSMSTAVWNVGSLAGSPELDVEVFAYQIGSPQTNWQSLLECLVHPSVQSTNMDHGTGTTLGALGTTLANTLCLNPPPPPPPSWDCSGQYGITLQSGTTIPPWTCYDPGNGQGQYSSPVLCDALCKSRCLLDVVIAVDVSGSTAGPGSLGPGAGLPPANPDSWFGRYDDNNTTAPGSNNIVTGLPNPIVSQTVGGYTGNPHPFEAQRMLLEKLLDDLKPGMIAGDTQVGVVFWADQAESITPDGFSMSTGVWDPNFNNIGDLSTDKILADNNLDLHSPIAYHMMDYFGSVPTSPGTNPGSHPMGGGTDIRLAMRRVFDMPNGILQQKSNSALHAQYPARQNDPEFIQIGIIITDSKSSPGNSGLYSYTGDPNWPHMPEGCMYQSSSLTPNPSHSSFIPSNVEPWQPVGPANQFVVGCVARPGSITSLPPAGTPPPWAPGPSNEQHNIKATLDMITCNQNAGILYPAGSTMASAIIPDSAWPYSTPLQEWGYYVDITSTTSITAVGSAIATMPCEHVSQIPGYDCNQTHNPFGSSGTGLYTYSCDPVIGGGQYTNSTAATNGFPSALAECEDACRDHTVDPTLTWPPLGDPCEKCCCESTPTPPWTCIPGTQVMTIPSLNPCSCATMGMIDCTGDVGLPLYGYDCPTTGPPCVGPVLATPGVTFTAANAALQTNPVTGQPYPNTLAGALAWCNDSCLGTAGTVWCPRVQSCPCGWDHVQSTTTGIFNCTIEDVIAGITTMPAIMGNGATPAPGCLFFPPPNTMPAIGDIWAHSGSYAGYSWTDAQVVDTTGFVTASGGGQATRTSCNP